MRVTPQRLAILGLLEGNTSHPTAEEVYRILVRDAPTLTRATVYQTLKILKNEGIIRELNLDQKSRHYDPDTTPHHHAICRICRKVRDIGVHPKIELDRDEIQNSNFEFSEYQISFYGICEECRADSEARTILLKN